ncbi:MAG TPA: phosphoenolpyruvate carboxykinase (ATP) [Acholeplasmataceae bacterium]|nr:phosphoenolpyruvate carboxykinase (ATP) [Acholeplasmataceae bacterium]
MATKSKLPINEIGMQNPKLYSRVRTIIETPFNWNNVHHVKSLAEAYELAKGAPGTIVTGLDVYNAEELGLPKDAKVLLFNDGKITGRQARLRRLVNDENRNKYADLLREVVFHTRKRKMYHAQVYVGLDKEFMIKAHLLVPEGYENTLYSWMLNFQAVDEEYSKVYQDSILLDEGDIYIFANPDLAPAEFPEGLALFDADHNSAAILGMRYFGEFKKGTLTLAWTIAERNGYTPCHGGQKRFNFEDGKQKVISVFGLSGSGKSTITLSNHDGKLSTTVLHDDAFIISNKDASSICLEQSYFDKTQDYPLTEPQSKYFVTIQNCGATLDSEGRVVPVTEDIQSGNGRTVKSRFAAMNREYRFSHPCDAIFWIMKDNSLPPVVKVNQPELASVMGATLATKRTTAEYVPGEDPNKLVIVPYANPFRLYPLEKDYLKFKQLFEERKIDCYIINTGFFLDKKIGPKTTLGLIEDIVTEKAKFEPFGPFSALEYYPIEGYLPDFTDRTYLEMVKARLLDRLNYVSELDDFNKLPEEALNAIKKVTEEI